MVGGHGGDKPIFQVVGGFPQSPLEETLLILMGEIKKQRDLEYLALFL